MKAADSTGLYDNVFFIRHLYKKLFSIVNFAMLSLLVEIETSLDRHKKVQNQLVLYNNDWPLILSHENKGFKIKIHAIWSKWRYSFEVLVPHATEVSGR